MGMIELQYNTDSGLLVKNTNKGMENSLGKTKLKDDEPWEVYAYVKGYYYYQMKHAKNDDDKKKFKSLYKNVNNEYYSPSEKKKIKDVGVK